MINLAPTLAKYGVQTPSLQQNILGSPNPLAAARASLSPTPINYQSIAGYSGLTPAAAYNKTISMRPLEQRAAFGRYGLPMKGSIPSYFNNANWQHNLQGMFGVKPYGTPEEVAAGTALAEETHKPGGPGRKRHLFGRIGHQGKQFIKSHTNREARLAYAKVAPIVLGGMAAGGAFAGAGAAGAGAGAGAGAAGAGAGAGAGALEGAGFIDPFLAGGGAGMAGWAPVAGGVASGTGGALGAWGPWGSSPVGSGGGGFWGSLGQGFLGGGGGGGNMWGEILGKAGAGLLGNYLNNRGNNTGQMSRISTAPFMSGTVQELLPPYLQYGGPIKSGIESGLQQIGHMIQNPGQLAPGVAEAIAPRLAAESQSIGTNYRGLQEENAGAAARTNAPVSLKNAISAALGMGQERAQREARMSALTESDQLRRQDLQQTYALMDAILQHLSSARGQAVSGLGAAQTQNNTQNAALMAFLGQLASSQWPSYMGQNPGPG